APPALEERLAAGVDVERAFRRIEEAMHAQVGLAGGHRRPSSKRAAEMVRDRILYAQRHEVEALHGAAMRVGLDLERALGGEMLAPAHVLRAGVDVLLVAIREARDAPKDPA